MGARRIRARREDIKIALKQRLFHAGGIRLYYKEAKQKRVGVAVIVTGVKKAVERNRLKRVIREAVWSVLKTPECVICNGTFVFMATAKANKSPFSELIDQVRILLRNVCC